MQLNTFPIQCASVVGSDLRLPHTVSRWPPTATVSVQYGGLVGTSSLRYLQDSWPAQMECTHTKITASRPSLCMNTLIQKHSHTVFRMQIKYYSRTHPKGYYYYVLFGSNGAVKGFPTVRFCCRAILYLQFICSILYYSKLYV